MTKQGKAIKDGIRLKTRGLRGKETIITEGKIKDTYGYLPKSVWDITKSKDLTKIVNDSSKERYRDGNSKKPLSEFNPDVAKRCLQIWSDEGDYVLDPFMNRGTTSIMAAYFGRYGYANEIVPSYYKNVQQQINKLVDEGNEWAEEIYLNNGDAKNIVKITEKWLGENGQFNYIYTSPPYWNVEKYESVKNQLSDIKDYAKFLKFYQYIIDELYKVLKKGKFCTFVVNDFRRNGEFYWFSGDTISCFQQAGFKIHDIVVNVVRTPHVSGIENAIKKQKRTLKYHEYILTFRKV